MWSQRLNEYQESPPAKIFGRIRGQIELRNRSVSPETSDLLGQLHERRSWIERLRREDSGRLRILERVGESGEPAAIPWVLSDVFSTNQTQRQVASTVVGQLVKEIGPQDVVWFSEYIKSSFSGWHSSPSPWQDLHPSQLRELEIEKVAILKVASCHGNGYVREASLEEMSKLKPNGALLPFMIIRLNDWVEAVRNKANWVFLETLQFLPVLDILPCVALLPWMRQSEMRAQMKDATIALVAPLVKAEAFVARLEMCDSDHVAIRREGYRILCQVDGHTMKLVDAAFSDPDPIVAGMILSQVAESNQLDPLKICESALRSPHATIRAKALRRFRHIDSELANIWAKKHMFDYSPTVREAAREGKGRSLHNFAFEVGVKQLTESDARGRAAALLGLSELGHNVADVRELLCQYRGDSSARVRASVLRGEIILGDEPSPDAIIMALSDPSPRVSRTAAFIARKRRDLSVSELWRLVNSSELSHIRNNAFGVLIRMGKWKSLRIILDSHGLPFPELRKFAELALRRWLANGNRSQVAPSEIEKKDLRISLLANEEYFAPHVKVELEFWIK